MKSDKLVQTREAQEFTERLSPDRKTVRCPVCNDPHGLWYRISPNGKKSLLFTCNKVKDTWFEVEKDRHGFPVLDEQGKPKQRECFRTVTKSFECPVFIDGLPLFEDWSPAKRKEHQKKHQHQLPLMK